jgi:DNA-binding PadR family transcriptional regulator
VHRAGVTSTPICQRDISLWYGPPVRHDVIETMVLGILQDGPTHGYALRKRLSLVLGPFRALSYGSLYPCLKRLESGGFIERLPEEPPAVNRRSRVVYGITPEGKERFNDWLTHQTPDDWEDEGFAARMAFFSWTESRLRLRILQGRRARLEERLSELGDSLESSRRQVDTYLALLHRHGYDGAQREVTWIDQLITDEQGNDPEPERKKEL